MADDTKTQQQGDPGPQPTIDADQIRETVMGTLQEWQAQQQEQARIEAERAASRPQPTENRRNPMHDIVAPVVRDMAEPALRALDITANDAKDAALFYVEHPEALTYKKDLENASDTMKRQGTPMTREALWDWYRGKNFDKFRDQANKKQQEDAERAAREAATLGPGSPNRDAGPQKDPHDMTDEELAKAVQGVAF